MSKDKVNFQTSIAVCIFALDEKKAKTSTFVAAIWVVFRDVNFAASVRKRHFLDTIMTSLVHLIGCVYLFLTSQ